MANPYSRLRMLTKTSNREPYLEMFWISVKNLDLLEIAFVNLLTCALF